MDEKASILIVDDDEDTCETLRLIFEKNGYAIETVGTGREAIEKVHERSFNLAFVDIKLPDMVGIELLAPLKEVHPDMLVTMITAYASLETAVGALNQGASGYLTKPLNMDHLLTGVREGLERQRVVMGSRSRYEEVDGELADPIRTQETLRHNAEFSDSLLKNSPNPILVISPDTSIRYVNPALQRLTGFSSAELIGRKTPYPWWTEETLQQTSKSFQQAMRRGARSIEEFFKKKSGERFWVEITSSRIRSDGQLKYLVANWVDITRRKQAEQGLRESEEKYRLLVDNINEGVTVEQDGMLRFFNPKVTDITGYSHEELASMPFTNIIHPDDRDTILEHHLKRLKGEELPHVYLVRIIDKNENIKWVEINTVLITWEGSLAFLSLLNDITERERADEERRESCARLKRNMEATVRALASAVETRDLYTAEHQRRVTELACAIAVEMGLSEEQIDGIRLAGLVHDVGKIYIPGEILSKPATLSEIEYAMIKTHPQISYDVLKSIEFPRPVAQTVLQHHERLDGSGYPQGLSGEQILLEARILAVADVVEAMASYRPYRPAIARDEALQDISRNKGMLYDAKVVDACLRLFYDRGFHFEQDMHRSTPLHRPPSS